jgi:hypothetical protein
MLPAGDEQLGATRARLLIVASASCSPDQISWLRVILRPPFPTSAGGQWYVAVVTVTVAGRREIRRLAGLLGLGDHLHSASLKSGKPNG